MIQLSFWDPIAEVQDEGIHHPETRHPSPKSRPGGSQLRTPNALSRGLNGEWRVPERGPLLPESGSPNPALRTPDFELQILFGRVFRRLRIQRPTPEFHVEYRAFVGLRSSVRLLGDKIKASISDLLADAPPIVLEALVEILLSQLFRRKPSKEARECYVAFVMSPDMRRRIDETRRARGHKRLLPPQGRYFNLQEIFDDLNRRFFQGRLAVSRIGWSRKRSRTLLGHFDSSHATITVSSLFDSPSVPRYLVEYLMFHEMLHILYPVERNGHRRVVHSRAFREAEKKFPHYEKASRQLKGRHGTKSTLLDASSGQYIEKGSSRL